MEQLPDRRPPALGYFRVLPDEILCDIMERLQPRDVGILACVSSVFYILSNEEPLWMKLCLQKHEGLIEYKGTWKQTALEKLIAIKEAGAIPSTSSLCFQGFSSLFLFRRWYRCNVDLGSFSLDNGALERRHGLLPEEFGALYDAKKPVLLTGLTDSWPAMHTWSIDQLVQKHGDVAFKVSQNHGKKVLMRLKDYASYIAMQHDEDPLYIFDSKFGEVAPSLLQDYMVPDLFKEDFFDVLDESQRPPFRWLVIGPARSGASWHVDPVLTSAWNTLIVGKKRWALYPPGRVPPAVVVHVDEEDGDVDVDGPSSLQWWLNVYPSLDEDDKPLECTQLPGETIFVPSGWWHCVLNIETSVAVTQNFVNSANLEFVCLDMAPGYRHRGVARAGVLALEECERPSNTEINLKNDITYAEKDSSLAETSSVQRHMSERRNPESLFTVDTLASFVTNDSNLYLSLSTKNYYLGPRSLREWLRRLWIARSDLRPRIWKGACLALDARAWLDRVIIICDAHGFPHPTEEELLPVGNGSNPVFLTGEYAIKLYVDEDGGESSIDGLGSELQFYSQLAITGSQLQGVVPDLIASGILYHICESYKAVSWDGCGNCAAEIKNRDIMERRDATVINTRFRTRWAQAVLDPTWLENKEQGRGNSSAFVSTKWPYLVTKRCRGENLAYMRSNMTEIDLLALADFLGEQVQRIHSLLLPSFSIASVDTDELDESTKYFYGELQGTKRIKVGKEAKQPIVSRLKRSKISHEVTLDNAKCGTIQSQDSHHTWTGKVSAEWQLFVAMIRRKRAGILKRFKAWDFVPIHLREQVEDYLPIDPVVLIGVDEIEGGTVRMIQSPVWLHVDLMDDNIQVKACKSAESTCQSDALDDNCYTTGTKNEKEITIQGCCILDFGDVCIGDPLYELVALYLEVFRGDSKLLENFLLSYRLPLSKKTKEIGNFYSEVDSVDHDRVSYRAMCYCILHEENVLSAVFKIWKDLVFAQTWMEVESKVWGVLNKYESGQVTAIS